MWAVLEMVICANPALFFYYAGPGMADILFALGNDKQRALANAAVEAPMGRNDGADRARCRLRCGCRAHQSHRAARRLVAHRGWSRGSFPVAILATPL